MTKGRLPSEIPGHFRRLSKPPARWTRQYGKKRRGAAGNTLRWTGGSAN